jgi:glycosyltransferase involved in cell wall biosynthesis
VVTPVLNSEAFVEQTILSIINQDYKNIEYIIIDGGSTDGTLDIIKKYADKIDLWVSEPDKGIYDAQNKGVFKAKGEYFAVLNSGDYFAEKDVVSKVAAKIKSGLNVDYVYSDALLIKQTENNRVVKFYSDISNILKFNPIPHPTLFSKTEFFKKSGGFDCTYKVSADYDYVFKLLTNNCSGLKIDAYTVFIRQGGYSYLNMLSASEILSIQKKYCKDWLRIYFRFFLRVLHFKTLRILLKIIGEKKFNKIKQWHYSLE